MQQTLNGHAGPHLGRWQVSLADYHADKAESNSRLKVFAESIPQYYGRFVAKTIDEPDPGPSLLLGQGTHFYLEGARFSEWGVCLPEVNLASNDGKEEWRQWVSERYGVEAIYQGDGDDQAKKKLPFSVVGADEEKLRKGKVLFTREDAILKERAAGRVVLTPRQNELIPRLADAIMANKDARRLLESAGEPEVSVKWRHESGLIVRNRYDRLLVDGPIIDFKVTDPAKYAFRNSFRKFRYDMQTALYLEGRWRALDEAHPEGMVFIVVDPDELHETVCYRLSPRDVEAAHEQNTHLLHELRECYRTNTWESRYQGIQELELSNVTF